MSYPGKVVARVLQQFSRFGLSVRNKRICSRFGSTISYLTCVQGTDKFRITHLFARELLQTASTVRAMAALSPNDPSSYSRPELAIVRHVSLALDVDFGKKMLSGSAVLNMEALQDIDQVILDARDLTIQSIELDNGTNLKYTLDGTLPDFGSKLTIELPHVIAPNEKINMCKLLSYDHAPDSISSKPTEPYSSDVEYGKNASKTLLKPNLSEPECLFKTWPGDVKTTGFHLDPQDNSGSCQSCKCESDVKIADTEVDDKVLNKNNLLANKEKERDKKGKDIKDKDINELKEKNEKVLTVFDRPPKTELEDDTKVSYEPRFNVKIKYYTAPNASALQWLEPSQTSGKIHPYMFSQCQPIHARSILPCQDTPSVKFTYDARVTAPEEFTVLMSALRNNSESNLTTFKQPVPIPSYLLAIAVGVLEHRTLGPRSIVWTEKEEIERAAWEFNDTEKYLQAAERLCGPYVWSQYDLLVLPPSFPYGGMENPCLTFVTPTLLAGDRSQADVIVHEIMHSWTGNLVTNKNFEHFWLNEGFTVFLERKVAASLIQDPVESKRSRDFHSLLGLQELGEAVNGQFTSNNPLTRLVPDLKGVHPDDAFSRVPYEKGSLFLRYLEDLVGGPVVFDGFLQAYLSRFQKQSIDTDQFKAYILDFFKGSPNYEKLQDVDWNTWLYTPGMPPIIPDYDNTMTKAITALLTKLSEAKYAPSANDVKSFSPHQIIHLLQELIDRPPLNIDTLETIGTVYKIAESKNSEIVYRWLRLCVRSKNQNRLPEVFQFVNTQGRMKYVRPLYRDLYAWEDVRQRAINNFLANEKFMMHVSAYTVRKDLHLND